MDSLQVKRFLSRFTREHGNFPWLQNMIEELGLPEEQITEHMDVLLAEGHLIRENGWYAFAPVETIDTAPAKDEKISVADAMVSPVKKKRGRPFGTVKKVPVKPEVVIIPAEPIKGTFDLQIKITRVIMGFIGIGSSVISVFYTSAWSREFLPLPLAFLLSFIMVGFSIAAFEVVILFHIGNVIESRRLKNVMISAFISLWLVSAAFSFASTVAGQINKQFRNLEAGVDYGVQEQWQLLNEQEQDFKTRVQSYQQELSTYSHILSGVDTIEAREANLGTWNEINHKMQVSQRYIVRAQNELEKIREQKKALLTSAKGALINHKTEEKSNFYLWLAKTLNARTDRVQLFLAVLPALFADAMAPFGIAIALFLGKKS